MAEDVHGFIPGPLDELVPNLRMRSERLPALPVHPRISRVGHDDGTCTLLMASFAGADDAKALHRALKPILEAALLAELSQPAPLLRAGAPALRSVALFAFVPWSFDPAPALTPFALLPTPLEAASRKALALVRREAQLVDGLDAAEPLASFEATLVRPPAPLAREAETMLRDSIEGPFGREPGLLSRKLADFCSKHGYPGIEPTRAGIERLEALLVQRTPDVIRFIDPLCFQALCDLVAVSALTTWGKQVEWAVCDPDDHGLHPPPLVRVSDGGEPSHVPLGEHVMRWCVMPCRAGEDIPTLGAWAEHEFGG
jgi:hypothetical protein